MRLEPLFAWWVVALIFAPFIIWLVWLTIRLVRKDPSVRLVGLFRAVGIVVCLALIAIGPSIPGGKAPAGMVNLDVVIVIDRTASISAEDYDGDKPRLEGVKRDVLMTIEALKGARIALVTSDTEVNVRVPFTSDSSAVSTAVRVLDQEVAGRSKGTSIDMPVDTVVTLLKKSKDQYPEKGRLIFYVGDGEQTTGESPKSFSDIKPLINGGAVLGYGTEKGGRMKTYYGYQDDTYKPINPYIEDLTSYSAENNYGFSEAISKIDQKNLQKIADDIGIKYNHRTSLSQPIDQIVSDSNMQTVADNHRQVMFYVNLYWVAALVLVVLLLWWLLDVSDVVRNGIRKERSS